jgi:hypothetical protein
MNEPLERTIRRVRRGEDIGVLIAALAFLGLMWLVAELAMLL